MAIEIDVDKTKIGFTPRSIISLIISVIVIVSGYFVASERTNERIDELDKKIETFNIVVQSQQELIMANRFRDSIEIDYLRKRLKLY
jgi:Tfp pilus assembly protein PilO